MTNPVGLYLHIPFCQSKCSYCNFYSFKADDDTVNRYTKKLIEQIAFWGGRLSRPVSSVYIGGGTPSVLSGKELSGILDAVHRSFSVMANAEITVEMNPGDNLGEFLPAIYSSGANRISLGVQSANPAELALLSRRHTLADVENAVKLARNAGFSNISLDLMLGLPGSDSKTLKNSIDFICRLNPEHISAYILKLEPETPLYNRQSELSFPDDDTTAEQYLLLCEALEVNGYEHYEISNFARKGFHSRHNTAYWQCGEYLGLGPAAHSFLNGHRFYYPPDLKQYLLCPTVIHDGTGGDAAEFVMLTLRLTSGLEFIKYEQRYKKPLPQCLIKKAELFAKEGLCIKDEKHIALTARGMLVSNAVISSFLEDIENENL